MGPKLQTQCGTLVLDMCEITELFFSNKHLKQKSPFALIAA